MLMGRIREQQVLHPGQSLVQRQTGLELHQSVYAVKRSVVEVASCCETRRPPERAPVRVALPAEDLVRED